MPVLLVVLVCLSTYRLSRLVVADRATEKMRQWVVRRFGQDSYAAYFVFCPWCVSPYFGIVTAWVALEYGEQKTTRIGGLALTASAITGLISSFEPG